ncbi:Cartilage intermediate layer protein 2 [Liparis tanakae]|uniref:Cartilage intermediate layer protein 2 n=1 Tax=Liparis tanakae TaxID=230148 RepID=A0A4Z2FGE7_9TELE|nr:Cartilage intermediate layer protein 2 [Liparis tanakae]
MFTCTGPFCSECRTRWFDHDDPTGNGDFEVFSDLRSIYPREICPQPIAIEVQTISGEPASSTSNTFLNYDATYGFACVNADQGSKSCEDYKVRFTCPNEFCQGCRTGWFNMDNPTSRGDYETLLQLQMLYPSQVCSRPVAIEAMTVSGVPAHKTGDVFQM